MFAFINKIEQRFHLGRITAIIAGLTLLSRFTGFFRDLILASRLGLSSEADIYFTAFRLPDLVYNLLILGTLSAAFIPVFTSYYSKNKEVANDIAVSIFNTALITMSVLCGILFIFAIPLTKLIAPGFSEAEILQTAGITRILLLSPIIFTASSVISSTLLSLKKFIWVNTAPLFYNAGIIVGLVWFMPQWGLTGLALGVILGAVLHFSIQLPQLFALGIRWRPILHWQEPGVQKIAALFVPRIFGIDISYINLVIVSIVGSTLATGSIAAFNYAVNIQSVPLGVFALSTTMAIFPILSENFATNNLKLFLSNLKAAFVRILFFIAPFSVLLLLMRAQIVRLLLGYGKCDWTCTITTFDTLGLLTLSLCAQSLITLLSRAFYARQNTKVPVLISVGAMFLNAGLSYWLSFGLGIVGIALGFVVASIFQFALLLIMLHRNLSSDAQSTKAIMNEFGYYLIAASIKILIAAAVMGVVTYGVLNLVALFVDTHTVIGILIQGSIAASVAGAVYLFVTALFDLPDAARIRSALAKSMKFFNVSGIE